MKIVMITRKVDRTDALAGFTYSWVKAIAANVEHLDVICLGTGDIKELPSNVAIYSAGKERHVPRLFRWITMVRFIAQFVRESDGVFCHMNPEYAIAAGPFAKLFKKKLVFWYTHRAVTVRLKIATFFADTIVTASKESFRLTSQKVVAVGHGIDTEMFSPDWDTPAERSAITVGRISPTKDYESMIKAVYELHKKGITVALTIVGEAGLPAHQQYFESLQKMVTAMSLDRQVTFLGAVPNREIAPLLRRNLFFINMSDTGSVDKAVLEAMACGCVPITGNEAFATLLPPYCVSPKNDPTALAEKLRHLLSLNSEALERYRHEMVFIVQNHHQLDQLAKKIISFY